MYVKRRHRATVRVRDRCCFRRKLLGQRRCRLAAIVAAVAVAPIASRPAAADAPDQNRPGSTSEARPAPPRAPCFRKAGFDSGCGAAAHAPRRWTCLHQIWYTSAVTSPDKVAVARFFRLASGREPAREWLRELTGEDRKTIGRDLMKIEFGWPCGPPLCRPLTGHPGLYEVRSRLTDGRNARLFFTVSAGIMVLLHGFIKKSRATPERELKLAERRRRDYERNG